MFDMFVRVLQEPDVCYKQLRLTMNMEDWKLKWITYPFYHQYFTKYPSSCVTIEAFFLSNHDAILNFDSV